MGLTGVRPVAIDNPQSRSAIRNPQSAIRNRRRLPLGMGVRTMTADRGDAGRRLDLVLRRHLTDLNAATRTRVQAWIESGHVTVNGRPVRRVAARAALGDVVRVAVPP